MMNLRVRRTQGERGSITLPILVLTPALLVVAGLVVDGGYALSARQRAFNEAEQAARAGAGAVSPASLRGGSVSLVTDCSSPLPCAQQRATAYVTATGDTLTGDGVVVTPTTVTVTVQAKRRSVILSIIGISELTVSGTGTAEVQRGITAEEPAVP